MKKLVPVGDVSIHPLNVRMVRTDKNISRLAKSIKQRRMEYPLKVVRDPRDPSKYLCYDGGYRLEAAKVEGIKKVLVEIENIKDETELILRSFNTADKVVPLNPMEEAKAFNILMGKFKDIDQVGDRVGRHWRYVKDRLALLNLVAKAQKLVLSGKMTWLPAYNLAKQPRHVQGKVLKISESEKYPGYDNIDITRALSKVLGKTSAPSKAPKIFETPKAPSKKTNLPWVCPGCGACYDTYCHGDKAKKHSFVRVYD